MEYFKLNNGMAVPAVGFGCYNAKGGDNKKMFTEALAAGYTLFDTASFYETERALGEAIAENGAKRSKLFLQSKLWIDEMGYDGAQRALERSLQRLQTDYLDMYFIHWPKQSINASDEEWKTLLRDTYRTMERMVEEGTIRAIGLSNFLPHHLEHIFSFCNTAPAADQLEFHFGYLQERAFNYAVSKGLLVEAWSPLGRGRILEQDIYQRLAHKYGVSTSRLALRFLYQYGILSLPKSAAIERQRENLDIFNFEISPEDFSLLACLPNTLWSGEHPDIVVPARKSNFMQ